MKTAMRFLMHVMLCLLTCTCAYGAKSWEKKKASQYREVGEKDKAKITEAIPDSSVVTPKQPRRILMFYRCEGYYHKSIPTANFAVQEMGRKTGAFTVDLADDYEVFSTENLKQYDAIVLNSTTGMRFPEASQLNAFLDFIADGKGLAGIHAASDNFGRHPRGACDCGW